MVKLLGLDVGDSKIGVAVSDGLGYTAQGITTFKRRTPMKDLRIIQRFIHENDVGEVIVGLPLKMNGTRSSQTNKILAFRDFLANHLSVPVQTWDERLTTVQAIKILKRGHIRRKKRAPLIDKVAAVIILQGYLDYQNLKREVEEMPYADPTL
ncbi:Holliday junction resolvase RuvX [candidate division KSB3 bacterium]|uniref:Putative pre-16S rRNA nuclease n=1 Tax=candidate division KSB3 bacterium TaxID=2044937 RepID=A0A9D5JXG0_9BACT|nr:Holliday junction resolvase RuvX [candidate division KSB3 bacterium]MBD3325746.1 Holliday junction resolvase RuvX [candidate division KSB3 bacterium]